VTGEVDIAIDVRAALAEGPSWDVATQTLLWIDIDGRRVHGHTDTGDWSFDIGCRPGAVVTRRDGDLVVAAEQGFHVLDRRTGTLTSIADASTHEQPGTRMNDGKCDARGRFWAGTMASRDRPGSAHLYCLDPDGSLEVKLDGVSNSNGLGWSPDGRTMYYSDTPTRRTDAFDFDADTGSIGNRRTFVDLAAAPGRPDGLTVDADGCVWIAFWDGWELRRFTPHGELDRRVELPVQNVTSCAFGGALLADLFVTSARSGLTPDQLAAQPLAGAVFHVDPGTTGLPATRFGA
jgi:sugar lactone lactonase YvrE